MRRKKPGFTLIELLMVVLIIGLLVVMLVPVVTAVRLTVMASLTETRVWEIDNAIGQYQSTFGDYPPSGKPADANWSSYPKGVFELNPALTQYSDYKYFDVNYEGGTGKAGRSPGACYLVYFLLGPTQSGWSPSTHKVMAAWAPPSGLSRYLSKNVVPNSASSLGGGRTDFGNRPYFVFEDAFGLTGSRYAGSILYLRANPLARHKADDTKNEITVCHYGYNPNYRWYVDDTAGQYYWDCRGGPGDYEYYHGDGEHTKNMARLLRQNPKEFALISAGANHAFGYRGLNTHGQNKTIEGADWDNGSSDDITNFDYE